MRELVAARDRLVAKAPRAAYVGIILLATLSQLDPEIDAGAAVARLARAAAPSLGGRDAVDAVRNLVLFAGWGAVWLVTAGASSAARAVRDAAVTGAALSAIVEAAQLTSPVRTASVLDLASNALGALVGAAFVAGLVETLRRMNGRRSFVGMPALVFAAAYLGALLAEAVAPLFRRTPLPGATGGPLERLGAALAALDAGTLLQLPPYDVLLFLPAGSFGVLCLIELGVPAARAAWWSAGAGVFVSLVGELGHAALGHRIGLGAVAAHVAGVALGAWGARRWVAPLSRRLRGRARPQALLATYAILLASWSWRPLILETDPASLRLQFTADRFIPLRALGARVDLFSAADVVIQFLLFLPLGVLLAAWPLRRRGRLRGPLPAVYLAVALESAQILIAGRFFDVTDLLVQAAGAAMGWAAAKRAGIVPHGEVLPPAIGR
ncbi:MAG TPA: VanZ family protein [Longimicrobiales bacterium]